MTAAKSSSCEQQIAELTRGIELPLPPIADQILSIIVETIAETWAQLLSEGQTILNTGSEIQVNSLLQSRLNCLGNTKPMWSQLVSAVVRGGEATNFSGEYPEKRPDLSIYLTGNHASFPLIAECKILDINSNKGIGFYGKKGIKRFINGDYAWTNCEGIMIAYVRDGAIVPTTLTPHLSANAQKVPDPFQTMSMPQLRPDIYPTVHHSSHQRDFGYLSVVIGSVPGPINLLHLWL
jgi:hypothetical protein